MTGAAAKVTVVIPNWNGMAWLDRCLAALNRQTIAGFPIIVVDNGSTDGSGIFIRRAYPSVKLIELGRNSGFAHAANIGIDAAGTPYVVLLNTDTEAFPDWLANLVAAMESAPASVAAVSSQLLSMEDHDRIDDAGDALSWYGMASKRGHGAAAADYDAETEIFSPCAGAALYRRVALSRLGGFDDSFFAYLEDVDLGLRGRLAGYRYIYAPQAKVLHKGHGSDLPHDRYVELITRNRLLLFAKNVPMGLLLRHALKLTYGQIYFFAAYARPWASIKGYFGFLAALPGIVRRRRHTLQAMIISRDELNALLGSEKPAPPLSSLLKQRFTSLAERSRALLSPR